MTAAAADPRAQSFAANGFRLSEEQATGVYKDTVSLKSHKNSTTP